MAMKDLVKWFNNHKFKQALKSRNESKIDEVLAPLVQAITVPFETFNQFSIKKAVDDGYKNTNMVYRCVNIITDNMITLDFEVQDKEGNPIPDHPVGALLDNPNPAMPANVVKSIWWKQLELIGTCYIRFHDGPTPELWPLYPDKVRIIPSLEKGKLIKGYRFENNLGIAGNNINLLPDEVIQLKQVDPADGLAGISALRAGFRHVDILSEMDKWNYNAFINRVLADVIISVKAENISADEIDIIRESIERQISGSDNARKAIIAPGGTSVDKFSQTAVEMDFIESKKLTREDIAISYGVPLPMLGIYDNGTFNNVESAKRDFWEDTLIPKADNFCDTMTWFFKSVGLLNPDQKVVYKKQSIKALQRNYTERVKDSVIVQAMLMKAGYEGQTIMAELNRKFDLGLQLDDLDIAPPQEFDENGKPIPADPSAKPKKDKEKDEPPKGAGNGKEKRDSRADRLDFHWRMIDRKRLMYEDKAQRQFKKLFSQELDLMLKDIQIREEVQIESLNRILMGQDAEWQSTLGKLYKDVATDFGRKIKFDRSSVKDKSSYDSLLAESIDGFIARQTGLKVQGIRQKTMKDIEKIIQRAIERHSLISEVEEEVESLKVFLTKEVSRELGETYTKFTTARAKTIARTEIASASGYGQQQAFVLSGATHKKWVSSRDLHVRDSHSHIEGQKVEVDATFSNGCKFPGDPAGGAKEVVNCRCTMIAVMNEEEQ